MYGSATLAFTITIGARGEMVRNGQITILIDTKLISRRILAVHSSNKKCVSFRFSFRSDYRKEFKILCLKNTFDYYFCMKTY